MGFNEFMHVIKRKWRFRKLNMEYLPAICQELDAGNVVVLVGVTGSGKSFLAAKALPLARDISFGKIPAECDLIVDESASFESDVDDFIRARNVALAEGRKILLCGQCWQDVSRLLAGLDRNCYAVFNLNRVWKARDIDTIPQAARVWI